MARKAAALVESMANNHGFIDGNKRTTLILADLLIDKSGYDLVPLGVEDLETAMENLVVSTADGQLRFPQLEEWFQARLRKRNI
jgi:death-on-curing protein